MRSRALLLALLTLTALTLSACGAGASRHAELQIRPTGHYATVHGAKLRVKLNVEPSLSASSYDATLSWNIPAFPATTGYNMFLNGSQVASPTGSPYVFQGLACGTTFTLGVQAHNGSGGTGPTYSTSYTTPACATSGGLSVSGNQIMDGASPVHLRGAFYVSYEWACSNASGISANPVDQTAIDGMKSWHFNFIRIGVPEDCWLGLNGQPIGTTVASYKASLNSFVDLLHANGIYTMIGLMYSAPSTTASTAQVEMPDQDHSPAFWTSFATYFSGKPDTLLQAYGEPHPLNSSTSNYDWGCWLGGSSPVNDCSSDTLNCDGGCSAYSAMGMQQIVTTIRATGNALPIMLPGNAWGGDLAGWLAHKPTDPLNQLGATWDLYFDESCNPTEAVWAANDATCWNQAPATVAAAVPLVNAELAPAAHQVSNTDCPWTTMPTYLSWAESHNVGYAAWRWGSTAQCINQVLNNDEAGTPSSPWGTNYKSWVISKQ